ncbi:hypothetical protein TNCV_1694021 [Trichonephila clavipes]|nr:hypothetical protein TNCV_1694021 [Trichonephila clavipes]
MTRELAPLLFQLPQHTKGRTFEPRNVKCTSALNERRYLARTQDTPTAIQWLVTLTVVPGVESRWLLAFACMGKPSNRKLSREVVGRAVTQPCLSKNRLWQSCVTCCTVLLEPQLLDIMIVQFRNEKVSNHGSIPITIDCNVVAFIIFEEGFHQPIKRTKQSVFLDVTVFGHFQWVVHLWINRFQPPGCGIVLFDNVTAFGVADAPRVKSGPMAKYEDPKHFAVEY